MAKVLYHIPVRTISEANRHEFWAKRAKRVKSHRQTAYAYTYKAIFDSELPLKDETCAFIVSMARISKRRLDSDNLYSSGKACRDGIADAMGIDDGSTRLTWTYTQIDPFDDYKYGVMVEIAEYCGPKPPSKDFKFKLSGSEY